MYILWKWKVKVLVTQSCPTLCDLPGSSVHGILQARILDWVAFPSLVNLPGPGIKLWSSALQTDSLLPESTRKPCIYYICIYKIFQQICKKRFFDEFFPPRCSITIFIIFNFLSAVHIWQVHFCIGHLTWSAFNRGVGVFLHISIYFTCFSALICILLVFVINIVTWMFSFNFISYELYL